MLAFFPKRHAAQHLDQGLAAGVVHGEFDELDPSRVHARWQCRQWSRQRRLCLRDLVQERDQSAKTIASIGFPTVLGTRAYPGDGPRTPVSGTGQNSHETEEVQAALSRQQTEMAILPRKAKIERRCVGELYMKYAFTLNVAKTCGLRAVGKRKEGIECQAEVRAVHCLNNFQGAQFGADVRSPRQRNQCCPESGLAHAVGQLSEIGINHVRVRIRTLERGRSDKKHRRAKFGHEFEFLVQPCEGGFTLEALQPLEIVKRLKDVDAQPHGGSPGGHFARSSRKAGQVRLVQLRT